MATSTKDSGKKAVKNDAELAAGLVLAPLYTQKGGIQNMLKTVTSSGDPAAALAHMLFALFSNARNALLKNGMKVDNRAWLAQGGAVDIVIKDVLGIIASTAGKQLASSAFARDVKKDLMQIMQQEMAKGKKDQQLPTMVPGAGGAPLPQGGPPQGGLLNG